jgi:hypothetical protein
VTLRLHVPLPSPNNVSGRAILFSVAGQRIYSDLLILSGMREFRMVRALLALICIALLVCAAVNVSGDFAVLLILPFSFFVVFAVLPLPPLFSGSAVQRLSLLTLNISRGPPPA